MQGIDSDEDVGAGFDPIAVDDSATQCQSSEQRRGRTETQSFVEYLNRVGQVGGIAHRQGAVAKSVGLGGNATLHVLVPAELPERVREGRRCRVVTGTEEQCELVANRDVGQCFAGLGIDSLHESADQWGIVVRIGSRCINCFGNDCVHFAECRTQAMPSRRG